MNDCQSQQRGDDGEDYKQYQAVDEHEQGAPEASPPGAAIELLVVPPEQKEDDEYRQFVQMVHPGVAAQGEDEDAEQQHLAGDVGLDEDVLRQVVVQLVLPAAESELGG